MNRPKRLSQAFVKSVDRPGRYSDGPGSCGLSLLVKARAAGGLSKSFTQHLRLREGWASYGLGAAATTTVQQAREAAFSNAARLRNGEEVRRPRGSAAAKAAPTFVVVAEQWLTARSAQWKAEDTARLIRSMLRKHVPGLLNMPIDLITTQLLFKMLNSIEAVPTRKRCHKAVHSIIAHAIVQYGCRADNPADALREEMKAVKRQIRHHDALPACEISTALAKADERCWVAT